MPRLNIRQRLTRASLIGGAGLSVAWAIIMSDGSYRHAGVFLRCAGGGAFLAGVILADLFGRGGCRGWFLAGMGYSGATVLGVIFGMCLLPLDAAVMRAVDDWIAALAPVSWGWALADMMWNSWEETFVALTWGAALVGVHQFSQHMKGNGPV